MRELAEVEALEKSAQRVLPTQRGRWFGEGGDCCFIGLTCCNWGVEWRCCACNGHGPDAC